MRLTALSFAAILLAPPLHAQGAGHFPPDSLVNTQVIPHNTPVRELLGTMRGVATGLGVRCNFCHVGEEGQPLSAYDFPSDKKETKRITRQMMRMVAEINRRVDTLPGHAEGDPRVSCVTCHRGVERPVALSQVMVDAVRSSGADSAVRAYRALHQRYYGRDAYDFGEGSLLDAAFQLAQGGKSAEALALISLNEESFPNSSMSASARGEVQLLKGDTAAAVAAYRQAIARDSTNGQARRRLRDLGQKP